MHKRQLLRPDNKVGGPNLEKLNNYTPNLEGWGGPTPKKMEVGAYAYMAPCLVRGDIYAMTVCLTKDNSRTYATASGCVIYSYILKHKAVYIYR